MPILTVVPKRVLGGPGQVSPSGKITLAGIGLGGQGTENMVALQKLPEVQVVVASQAVTVRSPLTENDVVLRSVPVNLAPEGALQETRAVVGKVAMTDLVPGEVILQQRLADTKESSRNNCYICPS